MRDNPNESDPAADLAGAGPDRARLNSELLKALAASVERNEQVQEKFRNAVVRRLARMEARARVLQLSKIVDWFPGGPVDEAAKREASCEELISQLGQELEQKMLKEISGERDGRSEAVARRGRLRTWSDWEI
jgi:hypothetical protein